MKSKTKYQLAIQISDAWCVRCMGCPLLKVSPKAVGCVPQQKNYDTWEEQFKNCPLKEVTK